MKKSIKILLVSLTLFFLYGCANVNKMPLNDSAAGIDTSQNSILVGRLTIKNENKPGHQPVLLATFVDKGEELLSFTKPKLIADNEEDGKEYFFSVAVPPGQATFNFMRFHRSSLLINAMADLHFHHSIDVPENQVIYLGNINATIVPREDGQPRAGSVIPLIDQSVAGFSSGTFVVEISDTYEADVADLQALFPYLADVNITKMILPQWVNPIAQAEE